MKQITTFTDNPHQHAIILLDDGSQMDFVLKYKSNQQGWFYDLVYGDFKLYGRRIVTSPNMLRAFRNIINFGLACVTIDGYEPIFSSDFLTGRASFYVLNAADVQAVETQIIAV